jgi:cytochrome P450
MRRSKRYPQYPIFTLPAVTSRVYVVTSPSLAAEVQRKRTLLFDPLVPDLTSRVFGLDAGIVNRMRINVDRSEGNWGILPNLHDANNSNLGLGELLDDLTSRMLSELISRLNKAAESFGTQGQEVNLLEWTQNIFTPATACGFYGPNNPLAMDKSLETDFWTFDHGLQYLLIGILPKETAQGPYYARERLVAAFKTYLNAKNDAQASIVVKKRLEILSKHSFTLDSTARAELTFLFAGIINTTVASFWLVLRLFANPQLLSSIRTEIYAAHGINPAATVASPHQDVTLRIATIKAHCPLLSASFRESMRLASDAPSTRLVTQPTTLLDKATGTSYDLAAGSIVQIAGAAMHADARIWGVDVDEFNPQRFLPPPAPSSSGSSAGAAATTRDKSAAVPSTNPAAYRAYGGGSTLCPGRHLAGSEVLAWTAAVVMALDVVGGETLKVPEKEDGRLPVHLCEPKTDVKVKLVRRGGMVRVDL